MKNLLNWLQRVYRPSGDGATAIEYALIGAGISLAIVGVVFTFGDDLAVLYQDMQTAFAAQL